MERIFENKNIMITGCNRGIGYTTMLQFAQKGANIIACVRNITDTLQKEWDELKQKYSINIYPLTFDLSDEDSIRNAMKELYSLKIQVDVLVNNAGAAKFSSLMMTKIDDVKQIFQINYFSPIIITQYVVKLMAKKKNGCIILLSSVAGIDGSVGNSAYGASKASIALLTKTLSKELGAYNIRVNAVAPGSIQTDMLDQIDNNFTQDMISATALKRAGNTEEVANTICFLASDAASYITGQIIRIDGGL